MTSGFRQGRPNRAGPALRSRGVASATSVLPHPAAVIRHGAPNAVHAVGRDVATMPLRGNAVRHNENGPSRGAGAVFVVLHVEVRGGSQGDRSSPDHKVTI